MRPIWFFVLVLGLGACAATPHYATVAPDQVTDLDLELVGGGAQYCPAGPEVQLRAGVHTDDGRTLATWSYGRGGVANREGQLDFATFTWTATAGRVLDDGRYQPPGDLLASIDRAIGVEAAVRGRPDLRAHVELSPRYDCEVVVERDGGGGGDGMSGNDGGNGSDGSDGDPPGSGANGGDGEDGGTGGDGGDAGTIEVALAYVDGAHGRHVIARVRDASGARYAILDPQGAPLSVIARGGDGGAGGGGGRGGRGGDGGKGTDGSYGSSGTGGRDGGRGAGGDGGDGGT
ncbi:MAG TPA: hypothetical protein VL463_30610, partial [Kofleriaceae bacterium]|nr:hypothetical protein [Kofleriaceae bacterium]